MLKKVITYKDYDDKERTETFYFNLSQAEVMEMELAIDGGLAKTIETITTTQDVKRIIELFKQIILKAFGEKSPDGKRFVKTQEIRDAFSQTEAYSQLFVELATDSDAATTFINAILPSPLTKN